MARLVLAVGVIVAVAVGACGGGSAAKRAAPSPSASAALRGSCPVTPPGGEVKGADQGFNYGDRDLAVALWPRGVLIAGRLRDGGSYATVDPDGTIVTKLGWWRGAHGSLSIEGERLDAAGPALRADIPDGYGPAGFQPTRLTFASPGCWKVTGSVGRARLTLVVLVRKRGRT